ncbi:MAG TPA: hypothetical protein DIT99_00120, partial [Candidatus Latescibacteria bacterium]|nr:hypothetical protein [Candidatus Latescibacterota bacterium]
CCLGGRALYARPSVTPADLTLQPNLSGVHRIIVGIGNGAGIVARLSGWDYPLIRTPASHETPTPFHLLLTGPQEAREAIIGETDMSGKTLTLSRFPNAFASTVIDYVRFEPLEKAADTLKQIAPPRIPLSGFCDIPDISRFTDARDPDPDAYRANLWEHANAGISKVFWRIDGQCSDFPCTTNTMRYISARVHGVFHPRSKAYGRVIKKVDILELAVATAHHYGLKLYGWMRFNNYTSNVQ